MDWFRLYHGTCTDAKLSLAKAYCGLPRPYVIAGWIAVLEHASSRSERGSLEGLSAELLAVTIDCSVDEAERLLAAFEKAGLVRDGRVASWEKRQPADPGAADRMRRHRARRRANGDGNDGETVTTVTQPAPAVTQRNAGASDRNAAPPERNALHQIRTEQIRSDSDTESLPNSSSSSRPGETRRRAGESGRADARAAAAAAAVARTDARIERTEQRDGHGPPDAGPPDDTGLRPDGLDPQLLRELADRCAMFGCPASRVERTVAGWLASMPPGLVNAAVAKALARAQGDPLAYAHRVATAAMVDLQVRRERAARDEDVPPWLQGYLEAIHGDEENRSCLPH